MSGGEDEVVRVTGVGETTRAGNASEAAVHTRGDGVGERTARWTALWQHANATADVTGDCGVAVARSAGTGRADNPGGQARQFERKKRLVTVVAKDPVNLLLRDRSKKVVDVHFDEPSSTDMLARTVHDGTLGLVRKTCRMVLDGGEKLVKDPTLHSHEERLWSGNGAGSAVTFRPQEGDIGIDFSLDDGAQVPVRDVGCVGELAEGGDWFEHLQPSGKRASENPAANFDLDVRRVAGTETGGVQRSCKDTDRPPIAAAHPMNTVSRVLPSQTSWRSPLSRRILCWSPQRIAWGHISGGQDCGRAGHSCEDGAMRAIMTVTGLDHTGIIAAIATGLAERNANITNVSQTLMGEYFTMILQVDFEESDITLPELQAAMAEVGREVGMEVRMQSEAIFNAMHKL